MDTDKGEHKGTNMERDEMGIIRHSVQGCPYIDYAKVSELA